MGQGATATGTSESMSAFLNSDKYTVEQKVSVYFADIPVMKDVAWCESKYRQTTMDGKVFRGEIVHQDVGVMQINEHYHGETAKKLGLDLTTLEGNLMYARYLYEQEGTKPWNASAKCWKNTKVGTTLAIAVK